MQIASKFAPGWILTTCVALALAVLMWLGFWQLDRLEEKTVFLEQLDASMKGEPEAFPDYIENPEEWEYKRVSFHTKFDLQKPLCIWGRNKENIMGYFHLLPVKLKGGQTLLVNMNWTEEKDYAEVRCPATMYDSEAGRLEGIIRISGQKNMFTPEPKLSNKLWYSFDPLSMDKFLTEDDILPLMLDNVFFDSICGSHTSEPYMPLSVPNDHLQYAMTWFGLALMLIGVYVAFGLQRALKNKPDA